MKNEYHLADGSPRYGHRNEASSAGHAAPAATVRVEDAAEGAARLSLDDMAAAINRRLGSAWADAPDPAVASLRKDHPEELAAARALVKLHLGSQRQWRFRAQAVRDKQLEGVVARRKASGSALEILVMRLGLMAVLIALPAYIVVTDRDNIVKLLVVGALCLAGAFAGGHFLTVRARVPVMPDIRGPWLSELREDIVNATLVSILQNKGDLEPRVVAAGRRGWEGIQAASKAAAAIQS
ncbi:hypothetical protein GCM10009712_05520 [Pseudarthrobacter sulfonivorans]|uniref:hypothetical protein n=1 Tax=Pseudarthrobacter sulfonivorans TaxID=121292 RepID=UPI00168BE22D|nr:hypothetical protein [Pseudarthrobacter sulfonivorans]